jgi:antitoxin component YwqK of YwqJK toxin-antitoxin module
VLCIATAAAVSSCSSKPKNDRIEAQYDKESGKLSQLTVDGKKDGKPDIYSYMDGNKFVRIETDNDEDGKIDRWEYYRPDQTMEKIGLSRAKDGVVDSWIYQSPDGLVNKVEISTRRDGRVSRVEFYDSGTLTRAEEDSDSDGQIDKWETYADGVLATVGFDTTHSGKPTRTIDYRQKATGPIQPSGTSERRRNSGTPP